MWWPILSLVLAVAVGALWLFRTRDRRALRALQERLAAVEKERSAKPAPMIDAASDDLIHRLNPHLFKNTLNTVQSFAYRTHWALERLGRLFDFVLYDARAGMVTLEEELVFLNDLIELNKLRLGPLYDLRIRIAVDANDPLYRERLVAPLVTASFIENAFRHGDLDTERGFVHIKVEVVHGQLLFEVTNRTRTDGGVQGRGGLGKDLLGRRLEKLYPGHHTITYTDADGDHKAALTIDLHATQVALRTAG